MNNLLFFSSQPGLARCTLLLACLSLPALGLASGMQRYGGEMDDSAWQSTTGRQNCDLRHEIPNYGVVVFNYSNRGVITLRLQTHGAVEPANREGRLSLISPPWKHTSSSTDTYNLKLQPGYHPLKLEGDLANWSLDSLKDGYQVAVNYRQPGQAQREVQVILSPLHFQRAYKVYAQCIEQLDPAKLSVAEAGFTDIHFMPNKNQIDQNTQKQLDRLASYLTENPHIKQLEITGHADSKGRKRHNMRLSQRRAGAVANYLLGKNVSKQRIKQQHVGESRPQGPNSSDQGRASNRRVELRFIY